MTITAKLALSCLIAAGTVLAVRHGSNALQATLPKDMPANAQFVQSGFDIQRNEPTGEWIACRPDTDQNADFCRVTDPHGSVIYQGDFLPVSGVMAPTQAQLRVVTSDNEKNLWVEGPTEKGPVPVIPLTNGQILAPVNDTFTLSACWAQNPEERERILGN